MVAAPIPVEDDPGGIYLTPEQSTRSVRTAPYGDGRRQLIVTGEHVTPGTARVPPRWRTSPPGGGAVVRVDGDRCAVYRDDDGTLHALSARCTHPGLPRR